MANHLFRRQLGLYASVHRDARNKATHFIGIPVIVFSVLLAATQCQFDVAGHRTSLAAALAVVAVLGWMALDLGIGIAMAAIMLAMWYAAEALAGALGPTSVWTGFAALFVFGWALQFLGHHFEGKRPALLDNLFQAFIGPMFLVAEVMVMNGYRRDLANSVAQGDVTTL
ncbi:MAG: DUF962 domain-containing protein [Proteobacteria bacterium]|nr:DUF962 domain-containing protein [Pseudomonadota bacterium]